MRQPPTNDHAGQGQCPCTPGRFAGGVRGAQNALIFRTRKIKVPGARRERWGYAGSWAKPMRPKAYVPTHPRKTGYKKTGPLVSEGTCWDEKELVSLLGVDGSVCCHRYIAPIISYPRAHIQVRPLVDSPAGRKAVDILLCIQMKLMLGGRRVEIGSKIKKSRIDAKLTQEQAAEALGISRQTISNWENEKSDLSPILCKLQKPV